MNLEQIHKLLTELKKYLSKHYDKSIEYQYAILTYTLNVLDSNEPIDYKKNYVVEAYKILYTTKIGLSNYYIWDDDYNRRIKLNQPLTNIKNDLSQLMRPYI